jgi:hypothetical protein
MKKAAVVLVIASLFLVAGCTTKYVARSADLEPKSRIGVLLVSQDGRQVVHGIQYSYVYNKIMAHGHVPVAVSEMDVAKLHVDRPPLTIDLKPQGAVSDVQMILPALTPTLQNYLKEKKVDFLLVMSFKVSGLDESLRAVLVRTGDMAVVASKFYDFRFMAPFCIPTGIIAVGALVCPFFYMNNYDNAIYDMIEQFFQDLIPGAAIAR